MNASKDDKTQQSYAKTGLSNAWFPSICHELYEKAGEQKRD